MSNCVAFTLSLLQLGSLTLSPPSLFNKAVDVVSLSFQQVEFVLNPIHRKFEFNRQFLNLRFQSFMLPEIGKG